MVESKAPDRIQEAWGALESVMDPEIPVVSIVGLGIVRTIEEVDYGLKVTMTPTFAGCPALEVIKREIRESLSALNQGAIEVEMVYSPPWSTDWIRPDARQALKDFGIAPAPEHGGRINMVLEAPARCPYCDADDTRQMNSFGPTACKTIHVCQACRQPFEAFKPL